MKPQIILNDILNDTEYSPEIIDKIKKIQKADFKQRQSNLSDLIEENTIAVRPRRQRSNTPNYTETKIRSAVKKKTPKWAN